MWVLSVIEISKSEAIICVKFCRNRYKSSYLGRRWIAKLMKNNRTSPTVNGYLFVRNDGPDEVKNGSETRKYSKRSHVSLVTNFTNSSSPVIKNVPIVVDAVRLAVRSTDLVINNGASLLKRIPSITISDTFSSSVIKTNHALSSVCPRVISTVRIVSVVRLGKAWTGNKQNKSEQELHG